MSGQADRNVSLSWRANVWRCAMKDCASTVGAEIRSLTFLQLRNRKPFCSWTRWMPLHCNRDFFSFPERRLWLRVPLHGAFRFWTYRSDSANGFGNNPILFPRSWLAMFDRRDLVTGDENKITFAFKKHLFKGYFIFRRPCVVGSWIYSSVSQV